MSAVDFVADYISLRVVSTLIIPILTFVGFNVWRQRCRRCHHWVNISRIQTSLMFAKTELKTQLSPDADRWKEISSLSFRDILGRLQSGELKAQDALGAFQYKAVQCSDRNNCVTEFRKDALTLAQSLDTMTEKRPLHGIPVSIKECFIIRGTESNAGHAPYIGAFMDFSHAPIVKFLEWAGCVPFVKTNIPQGMDSFDSRNAVYGTTTNPHDITRGPGGSSSGEGALIAGGGSLLGVGSDVGGSLRIPAAWSGCSTLKPTSQRMLAGGTCPSELYPRLMLQEFLACGFLARDVDTLVAVHRLLYSPETFQQFPFSSMVPVPFKEDMFNSTKKLKIAFYDYDGVTETVPAAKRALHMARDILEANGHKLVPWMPIGSKQAFILISEALEIDGAKRTIKTLNDDVEVAYANQGAFEAMKWPYWRKYLTSVIYRKAMGEFPSDLLRSLKMGTHPDDLNGMFLRVREFRRKFIAAFTDGSFDAILCPAFACPALPINSPRHALGAATYTCLFNLMNWPAGVLPVTKVTQTDEEAMATYPGDRDMYHRAIKAGLMSDSIGLPVAVQVAAPPYCEELVLKLMAEIETSANYKL